MTFIERMKSKLERQKLREIARLERIRARDMKRRRAALRRIGIKPRRKPPEAGIAMPAIPPKGPLPLKGGAAAPLDFD